MNRRTTLHALAALGIAATPLLAHAQPLQPPQGQRRVGVLMGRAESDVDAQQRLTQFKEKLASLGWVEGRNLALDVRWSAGEVERARRFAKELVALKPDVILANTTPVTLALQQESRSIPIVFTVVSDPIGSGLIQTLARPGGNITGFINLEASLIEKWAQLLKEVAPRVKQVHVMFNPKTATYVDYYLQALYAAAPKIGVKTSTAPVGSEADIQQAISAMGRDAGNGLIVMTDSFMGVHRKSIIALAARHKVPAIYYVGSMVEEGGLLSYGVDYSDLFRSAAPYVDRILRGAAPADLPVQQPTRFEMLINLKTAKALNLKIPHAVLLRTDRMIE